MATYDRGRKDEAATHRSERAPHDAVGRASGKKRQSASRSVQRDEKLVGAERFPRKGNEGDEE